jgi:hypothetical protein
MPVLPATVIRRPEGNSSPATGSGQILTAGHGRERKTRSPVEATATLGGEVSFLRRERGGQRMARRTTQGKAGSKRTARKRSTRIRAAAPARKARSAAPKKRATTRTPVRAGAAAPKRATAARRATARPKEKPGTPGTGQTPPESYSPTQPVSSIEPIRTDPWGAPVPEEHQDDLGMEDEEEDEEPL